ncbi:DMT family transporter [Brevibacillus sp. H7]|uniref:DMT family transporter n=1 Tax=Brevibacillus sp. H7 TaxID=3349138 RepID=UPI00382F69D7
MSKANLMLMAAVVLWGITIVPTKWGLETFPPFTLMFLRLVLASLIFLPFAWKRAQERLGTILVPWGRIALLSFTGVAGYFLFNSAGVALTSGVHASIISASLPLFTLLLAAFYLKETITVPQWLGLFMGTLGVLLITVQSDTQHGSSVLGDLLVLASELIWAIYVIQMKRPQGEERLPSELFTALTLFIGGIMILPFAAVETWIYGWSELTLTSLWIVVFLVLGPTIMAYWLWNKGIASTSAARAGIYLNAMPLISVLGSVSLLGEHLTWKTVFGGVLVLVGVFGSERAKRIEQPVAVSTE